jgi:hypothetical protein
MKRLILVPALAFAMACAYDLPVAPRQDIPGVAPLATSIPPVRTSYSMQATRDWTCGPAEGCSPGATTVTPSGVLKVDGFVGRFLATGGLAGEIWVTADFSINLNDGRGVAQATAVFVLIAPVAGTFECRGHADYEGYHAPSFAYIEHVRYASCRGTGGFDGSKMEIWMNNEAHPGVPLLDGTAEIW